jgi:hypothetical protein
MVSWAARDDDGPVLLVAGGGELNAFQVEASKD